MARKASLILAVMILLAAGYAVFAAKSWQWKAALFPLAIGIPLFCLAAAEVVWSVLKKEAAAESPPLTALPWVWLVVFLALVVLLGFPIAVAAFVVLYLKVQAKEGWLFSIVLTVIVWGAFYGLFDAMLHLPFPPGWVFEWLGFGG